MVIPGFGMNALILQDLLKYRIIGHSSFQNLDFLVATSFVPPSVCSKYIAYFTPSWKKYHSKLSLTHVFFLSGSCWHKSLLPCGSLLIYDVLPCECILL